MRSGASGLYFDCVEMAAPVRAGRRGVAAVFREVFVGGVTFALSWRPVLAGCLVMTPRGMESFAPDKNETKW